MKWLLMVEEINTAYEAFFFFFFFFSFFGLAACGILVPWPGTEPGPSAVKAPSPDHWTAREFPYEAFFQT